VGNDSHLVILQKLLGENRSVRRGIVMVKQPDLSLKKLRAASSHVFTQSLQNFAVEHGFHSLACWDRCFALLQLLRRWRHQFGIFWIPPRSRLLVPNSESNYYVTCDKCANYVGRYITEQNDS
jgi:hypothetical protein